MAPQSTGLQLATAAPGLDSPVGAGQAEEIKNTNGCPSQRAAKDLYGLNLLQRVQCAADRCRLAVYRSPKAGVDSAERPGHCKAAL
ncbi:hypothetical protein [Eoetvoesiella caeni]